MVGAGRGRGEAGKAYVGCLLLIFVVAVAAYVLRDVPGVFWRYYQMQDEVKSEASFAPGLSDAAILARLVATADTLGLPLGPKDWTITRAQNQIDIEAAYDDSVALELLTWRRVIRFHFQPHSRQEL